MNLPNIYKNKIEDEKDFEYRGDYFKDEEIFPYKAILNINNNEYTRTIIGKTSNYLVTDKKEMIYIKNIKTIKKVH